MLYWEIKGHLVNLIIYIESKRQWMQYKNHASDENFKTVFPIHNCTGLVHFQFCQNYQSHK